MYQIVQVLSETFKAFQYRNLVAELNSTPIWNLILQIPLPSIVEFNLSELSAKIFMEIWLSPQQEGCPYE